MQTCRDGPGVSALKTPYSAVAFRYCRDVIAINGTAALVARNPLVNGCEDWAQDHA